MLKIMTVLFLCLTTLFAHAQGEEHLHLLGSWHVDNFVFFLVAIIAFLSVFNYFYKEKN